MFIQTPLALLILVQVWHSPRNRSLPIIRRRNNSLSRPSTTSILIPPSSHLSRVFRHPIGITCSASTDLSRLTDDTFLVARSSSGREQGECACPIGSNGSHRPCQFVGIWAQYEESHEAKEAPR